MKNELFRHKYKISTNISSFLKMILIIVSILINAAALSVQNIMPEEKIDNAHFRPFYRLDRLATRENVPFTGTDTMTLDVGQKWSVYYDRNKMRRDSASDEAYTKNPVVYPEMEIDK